MTIDHSATGRENDTGPLDLAGIGVGPFNLSLAAVLDGLPGVSARFFERKPVFSWHPGLMLPGSVLQTSFLKDLVTPLMPTSPHSFTNFLVAKKRFYDFASGRFGGVSRAEFSEYLAWAAERIASVEMGAQIEEVTLGKGGFHLRRADGEQVTARNLSLGTGMRPHVPASAAPHLGDRCFHASEFVLRAPRVAGRRVAVVGGGQTGAEIVLHLLGLGDGPAHVSWINRRPRFAPLEEGAFVDQVFTPAYVTAYRSLPAAAQRLETADLKLASDGLTPSTIEALYTELYRRTHLGDQPDSFALLPGRSMTRMMPGAAGFRLSLWAEAAAREEQLEADLVILATGAEPFVPACLDQIRERLEIDATGRLILDENYRAAWDGPEGHNIFALNHGGASHGIVDPQLSLMAWRSGVIANTLVRRPQFDVSAGPSLVDWAGGQPGASAEMTLRMAG
jgi:lysine N6-hydroxylase